MILSLLGTGYVFTEQDFSHLHQFLVSCAQLSKYMASKAEAAPRVSSYATTMYTLSRLKTEIEQCIRHGQVVDTASKDLLKTRKRIVVFEERLKRQLDTLMNKYRSILQENMISMRNGRYVLPIKKSIADKWQAVCWTNRRAGKRSIWSPRRSERCSSSCPR